MKTIDFKETLYRSGSKEVDDESLDSKQPESVAAVLKVFAILQSLADRNETGVSELSMRLAMPKATVYRFLQTMRILGYVRQQADSERYGLTMKVFELGAKALQYPHLVELSKPFMEEMSDKIGETIYLGSLIDSEVICAHKIDARHSLGVSSKIGSRTPIHCTAIGKALLAWEGEEQRDRVLAGVDFRKYNDKTITNAADFIAELERTRAQGYGEDREEYEQHVHCIGVPIFDRMNQAVAGLSVLFPSMRHDASREPEMLEMLRRASRAISKQLGCFGNFPLDVVAPASATPQPVA